MILLTWNVARGRGTSAATDLAPQLSADVLLLQESTRDTRWSKQVAGREVPKRKWGSWVVPSHGAIEPIDIPGYEGWVAGGRWIPDATSGLDPLHIFSIHSPTKSKDDPRGAYVAESRKIVDAICGRVPSGVPLVIGGDFNFASFGERQQPTALKTSKAEATALQSFRKLDFKVAWCDSHPGQALPQTIRWTRDPAKPFHCDGFLLRGFDNDATQCEVLTGGIVARKSDHNAVAAWVRAGK